MTDCIFCKIVDGSIPSKQVHNDENVVAFLDINPATRGHVVVIPKKHSVDLGDIDNETLNKVMAVVKKMAEKVSSQMNAPGVNILQNNGRHAGQIVNHIHFHIIPRYDNDGIFIKFPRMQLSEEEMKDIQKKLKDETPKTSSSSSWI